MMIFTKRALALGGVVALMASAHGAAFAQAPRSHVPHHPVRHIVRLKARYMRDVAQGRYGAAERAHLHARAIRHALRHANQTP